MTPKEVIPKVQQDLFAMQDLKYRDFHAKLMPTVEKESVIGVRVPVLRTYAKKFGKTEEAKQFLKILPHQYYEENNLHGLLIDQMKDFLLCTNVYTFCRFIKNNYLRICGKPFSEYDFLLVAAG